MTVAGGPPSPSPSRPLVARVHALVRAGGEAAAEYGRLEHPEWLALAALVIERGEDGRPAASTVGRLGRELALGAEAEEEIALLVGDRDLLRAAAHRFDGLGEDAVLRLAAYLDRPERARALYLLGAAAGDSEWGRGRLDILHGLVQAALARPEVTGRPARNLVERRRAEATRLVGPGSPAAARIAAAPVAYLLAHDSGDVARHCYVLEPLPAPGEVAVVVTPAPAPGEWRLDVGGRDRPGLLATVTGVLTTFALDVAQATVATWEDGGALESFALRAATAPDPTALRAAVERAFTEPLASAPVADAEVAFDDGASPWYTLCDVRAPDRPGLLHALAVAFARAGADVHAAWVTTVDGVAVDRFDLTDHRGRKLDRATEDAVRAAVATGATAPRRRRWRGNGPGRPRRAPVSTPS